MDKNKKIKDILSSADHCSRAGAPDFFYTRLKARMEKEHGAIPARSSWVVKPVYAMAAVVAVLILNAFILFGKSDKSTIQVNSSDTDTFQSLAADYRLNDNNNLFDLTEDRQP
ncbi:MAG: hypothetical protein NTW29_08170 [Bacteroidetes bacterium]|nr:hypothetical protein [Bacteroidota bacterium]